MNAFFAAVEVRDFPTLRGKPLAVTNGDSGTTIITCSYEARAKGVKTGMRICEARRLCPELIQRPSRPAVYAETSARIMRALEKLSPDVEVFSVEVANRPSMACDPRLAPIADEAFVDVTHCQRLHGSPERMARMAQRLVYKASGGLPCSVGVAGTRLVAKAASELDKPNGITVIAPWEARERLDQVPMEKICGIGPQVAEFLRLHGARTCGDVARLPLTVLERRYGATGKRLWLACRGQDLDPVTTEVAPPKSVGHGKVLPPRTASRRVIETYLRHMCEKVAARLRNHELQTRRLHIALRYAAAGRDGGAEADFEVSYGPPDGRCYFELARTLLREKWNGEAVTQVQVTATHLRHPAGQLELFAETSPEAERLSAVDRINRKYGELTLAPATLLERSRAPNVIAPGWRPGGVRQYIPD
jgi:DNA polymerase-4